MVKNPAMWEIWVRSLGGEDPLEWLTHSSILAWRIPQTEEPGGLQSTGSQSRTRLSDNAFIPHPTPSDSSVSEIQNCCPGAAPVDFECTGILGTS